MKGFVFHVNRDGSITMYAADGQDRPISVGMIMDVDLARKVRARLDAAIAEAEKAKNAIA